MQTSADKETVIEGETKDYRECEYLNSKTWEIGESSKKHSENHKAKSQARAS